MVNRTLLDSTSSLSRLDSTVAAVPAGICVALGVWVGLVVVVAGATRLTASRAAGAHRVLDRLLDVLVPGLAGRVLRAALGLGGVVGVLGSGLIGPVASSATVAAPTPGPAPARPHPSAHRTPTMGHPAARRPGPDLWPLSTPAPGQDPLGLLGARGAPERPGPAATPPSEVVVHRGDTLWSIAARQLPATAPDQRIDALWRRWYERNRTVIGADPDLLLPGQVLSGPQ